MQLNGKPGDGDTLAINGVTLTFRDKPIGELKQYEISTSISNEAFAEAIKLYASGLGGIEQ